MNSPNDQPDDFDAMLKELSENWEQLSSQMMSGQLPTESFAISAISDFSKLLAESSHAIEKFLMKRQKAAGGIENTILPVRDKQYFKEFATSIGCVYVLAVLARRWDELEFLPHWMDDS